MDPWLLIYALTAPITILLIWAIVCEVRKKAMFCQGAPAGPGQLHNLGCFLVGTIYIVIIEGAFLIGGGKAVLLAMTIIAGFAAVGSSGWTVAQNVRHAWTSSAGQFGHSAAEKLPLFSQRLTANFVALIISIPVNLVASA